MDSGFDLQRVLKGKRKGGLLVDWFVHEFVNHLDEERVIVIGCIIGDERFEGGGAIKTSLVVAVHEKAQILETKNTYYELGRPASEETKVALRAQLGFCT